MQDEEREILGEFTALDMYLLAHQERMRYRNKAKKLELVEWGLRLQSYS